jgi:hypothetical protein
MAPRRSKRTSDTPTESSRLIRPAVRKRDKGEAPAAVTTDAATAGQPDAAANAVAPAAKPLTERPTRSGVMIDGKELPRNTVETIRPRAPRTARR